MAQRFDATHGEMHGGELRRARDELRREQTELREIATLVATGASQADVFAAITTSASELFAVPFASLLRCGADGRATMVAGCAACRGFVNQTWTVPDDDPGIVRRVVSSRRPARVEDHSGVHGPLGAAASSLGIGSVVGAPVIVDGSVWGVLAVGAAQDGPPLPADAGDRLVGFTELVTTTLSNAESRERVRGLLDEQDTLRRLATLIAAGADPDAVFASVCNEAVDLFDAEQSAVARLERDGSTLAVVGLSDLLAGLTAGMRGIHVGLRGELGEWPTTSAACQTGRAARRDVTAHETTAAGAIPDLIRAAGFLSTVSAPIIVEGRVWGAMTISDSRRALPADTETRIENFTELISTAIANAEGREAVRQLADEQAALRRVATLVAAGIEPEQLFATVSQEVERLFAADGSGVGRFEPDGAGVVVVASSDRLGIPVGSRQEIDKSLVALEIYRTGRTTRIDLRPDDILDRSAFGEIARRVLELGHLSIVAAPIVVEGELWGLMTASRSESSLPLDTEKRLEHFAELVATAIANAENREALRRLAEEQAALGRVATLVAQGASPDELFSAVAEEAAGIVDLPVVAVNRYEADGTFTIVGIAGETQFTLGSRWPIEEDGIAGLILAGGAPARRDDYATMPGQLGEAVREDRLGSTVGVPIGVDGAIWGFMIAAARAGSSIPRDTEAQLVRFTELVATAVSNASTRTELLTSRARLVSTADETRRRLERDLHDGVQQWLVTLALRARKAARLSAAGESPDQELSGLADDLVAVTDELREISRGIHPAILTEAGLDDALGALARRSAIRVDLDVGFQGRQDPTLEATVYYIVAESITNAVKHAQASTVSVRGGLDGDSIELEISDDGVGGATPGGGTGLIGLEDRVDTLGGTISLSSPEGAGTTIRVKLPASAPVSG